MFIQQQKLSLLSSFFAIYRLLLFFFFLFLLLCALLQSTVHSLPDNGILGEPYVDCGGDYMEVRFDTRNTFRGIVFVEGHLDEPQCRSSPADESTTGVRNAQIRLDFRSCGINQTRHPDPKGLFLSTRLVVAFNPQILSKFDRIYDVRCFYMEMEHEVQKELTVKMGPPVMHTKQVPMPVCKYEVLSGGPQGPPIFYATIGQMVYHKWTCESSEENQFCMIVHSCIVNDYHGDRVELIDQQGCARDKFLLQNLDYISDLMVGKEAHVYKYADRESMFFDCKITLSIKEPDTQFCPVPQCPDPPRRRHRQMRHLTFDVNNEGGEEMENKGEETNNLLLATEAEGKVGGQLKIMEEEKEEEEGDCISQTAFLSLVPLNLAMLAGALLLIRDAFKQHRLQQQ